MLVGAHIANLIVPYLSDCAIFVGLFASVSTALANYNRLDYIFFLLFKWCLILHLTNNYIYFGSKKHLIIERLQ